MLPDLDSLNLFARAVRLRSLSKAADACNISLSAASRRLSTLEHQFCTVLVDRLHSGAAPTAAGEALAVHAESIVRGVQAMMADLSDYARGAIGRVRLCANVSALSQELPEKLSKWSTTNETIKVHVYEMRSRDIVDAVRQGSADLGIVTTEPVDDLRFELYRPDPLCVIASASHSLRARQVHFAELLDQDFVTLEDTTASTAAMKRAAHHTGQHLRVRVQVHSFDALCRLVAACQGIGVVPVGTADAFKLAMKLRVIRLRDEWAQRNMYLCMQRGRAPVATARFAEHLSGRPLESA